MNWALLRPFPWLDSRARFVAGTPGGGALLDLGSSDGETLRHMSELRPDLRFFAVDMTGTPEHYPAGCEFHRANLEKDQLPWGDGTMDAITCMHLVEHLSDLSSLIKEAARLLKPGGRIYFETPHPKSLKLPSARTLGGPVFTLNFYDDPTHTQIVSTESLAGLVSNAGLEVFDRGISRNWLFAAAYPFFFFHAPSRKKLTAYVHWLGWSAYLVARKLNGVGCRNSPTG